jgi:prevent-host-death family protein
MPKRTPKSASSKAKTTEAGEPGTPYPHDVSPEYSGVRDQSAVRYERTSTGASLLDRRSVPATQAKNRFGEIMQTARESGPVFIERHGRAQAVVLGIDAYNKLMSNERSSQERELDYWTREFHALHARMQTSDARQAVDALFSATDAELNRRDT